MSLEWHFLERLWPAVPRFTVLKSLLCTLMALSLVGCGKQGEPPPSRVEGKVTYKGEPVTGGIIMFEITDANGNSRPYAGEIYEDGNYELTNAVPGSAVITVDTATQEGLPTYMPLPNKFANARQSGLTFEVQLGDQEYNIELE